MRVFGWAHWAAGAVCLLGSGLAAGAEDLATADAALDKFLTPNVVRLMTYACADGQSIEARYVPPNLSGTEEAVVYLTIDGRRERLLQFPAPSGLRYVGGGWHWWVETPEVAALAKADRVDPAAIVLVGTKCQGPPT